MPFQGTHHERQRQAISSRKRPRAQGTSFDAILGQLIKTIPSGRLGTGEDIADAACFLVSERASYVNGAALVIDGSESPVISPPHPVDRWPAAFLVS